MLRSLSLLAAASLFAPAAHAQLFVETYDNAHNEGDYEIWFATYNTIQPAGGNPTWYLELDDFTQGPATCDFLRIFPNTWPNAFSGDWRALNVTSVGLDANVFMGPAGIPGQSVWEVTLANDNGTLDPADDCKLVYTHPTEVPAGSPGWRPIDFTVEAQSTVIPPNWRVEGPCGGGDPNVPWNFVIQDVSYVEFRLAIDPSSFCTFARWIFGVDNMRLEGDTPLGTPYCVTLPNSTGQAAELTASGSAFVSSNNVDFEVVDLPANQFGYFLMGRNQDVIPVAQGVLCIGTPQVRFNGFILNSGAAGTASFSPNLANLPQMTTILPGETWNFQMWFRDQNPGTTSNFSNPLAIDFL